MEQKKTGFWKWAGSFLIWFVSPSYSSELWDRWLARKKKSDSAERDS